MNQSFALLLAATTILGACSRDAETSKPPAPAAEVVATTQAPPPKAPEQIAQPPAAAVAAGNGLTLVADRSQVCMVNNQVMNRPQIPVVVEGRTYFGCCEMCKARIEKDASLRTAVDPVSGAKVDKANAVIGARASGDVLYFENEANLTRYAAPS